MPLAAGKYKAVGALDLYVCDTYFAPNEYMIKVGSFSNGDIFTLENDGEYCLATRGAETTTNLTNSVAKIESVEKTKIVTTDIDTTIIDEPIGFDDLQMHIERNDYHGMGAEVSLGSLEFYNKSYDLIKAAYESDIDYEVAYSILDGSNEIYSGIVDLTTCSFLNGDYASVKAKVGEVGTATLFNNRTSTEIDLNVPKTINGMDCDLPTWQNLHIPLKHLLYTDSSKQRAGNEITTGGGYQPYPSTGIYVGTSYPYIFLPIGDNVNTEFGQFGTSVTYTTDDISNVDPQYVANEDHETKYGTNTKAKVEIKLNASITRSDSGWSPVEDNYIKWKLVAVDGDGNYIYGDVHQINKQWVNYRGAVWDLSCELSGELNAGSSIKYYLYFDIDLGTASSQYFFFHVNVQSGSYVKLTMYDTLEEVNAVNADMILVHDALNVVTQAISEKNLAVKSDWYRTPESYLYPGTIGDGACKALTNGYHIRGLFTEGEFKRNMPLSFKSLIESLDAMDCIGWGFSTELENNVPVTCLRVERWGWFYKEDVVATLTNVAEVNTDIDTDRIPTELKIGYKKYATQDQYNSIDSPHGTRTFTSGITALSKAITKESDFIADNYAIEEIRRARANVNETEETTYDESIFVFELRRAENMLIGTPADYAIVHSATDAVNVGRADEFINAKLTPRHMAARWRDYLFSTNNSTPFRFTSGEINYKSAFKTKPENNFVPVMGVDYLKSFALNPTTTRQAENDDITYTHAKFQAEKITFSCPISVAQYKAIKANPYGLVSVNGTLGWIMDFKYKFEDGMADFTLLAKYVPQNN